MPNDKYILAAVDPGFEGGIAFFDIKERKFLRAVSMPIKKIGTEKHIDCVTIAKLLKQADVMMIEQVASRPDQNVRSIFRFGEGYGMIQGIAYTLGLNVMYVTPQIWMKDIAKKMNRLDKPSIAFCLKYFPDVDWRKSARSKNPHDGKTDATCIGLYALKIIHS
jgi:hypothetical protein